MSGSRERVARPGFTRTRGLLRSGGRALVPLTSHLPLKVIPHLGDFLGVFLQERTQAVTSSRTDAPSLAPPHPPPPPPWKSQLSRPVLLLVGPLASELMDQAQSNKAVVTHFPWLMSPLSLREC